MSFMTLQIPREPRSSVGKPPLLFVAVQLRDMDYGLQDPPLLVFVIVNNQDELPMINNIALTLTPVLPE